MILLVSFGLPLLKLTNHSVNNSMTVSFIAINDLILSGTMLGANVSNKITAFDFHNILIWLYWSIACLLLIRLMISVARTFMIIKKGTIKDLTNPKVIISDMNHPPFSFFPYVVIPRKIYESEDYADVFEHEKTHIRQGHTFDLILCEILGVFQWFNPFIWLIKRSIVLNHEYLADNSSIRKAIDFKEYQYKLLNIKANISIAPLAHNFSSLIKNRLVMINKKPTRNYAALKNLLILPVAAILFVMFSFSSERNSLKVNSQEPLFSNSSKTEILKFLGMNTVYPQEARHSSDTGTVFVIIKMNKGGIIKECKASLEKNGVKVSIMDEVVIVGYGQTGDTKKLTSNDHLVLKAECVRVANKLGELSIPEWKDKNMEFALAFKFTLK